MATPAGRPTYGGWLDQIAAEGRTDDYGFVASAWANAQANGRPKLHAPKSVNRWLSEHAPIPGVENLQRTLHQLEQHYHNQSGLPDAPSAQVTSLPGATSQQDPGQAADGGEDADQDWFTSPDGQAWLASPEGQQWLAAQHPVSAGQEAMLAEDPHQQAAQPADPVEQMAQDYPLLPEPEHPYQVIMIMIARLESQISAFWQAMAPLIELAAESARVDAAIDASQLAQPSAAQQRAQQIAAEHGWTPGPEIPQAAAPPVDFYRGHVVAQPDFGRLADESDGRE